MKITQGQYFEIEEFFTDKCRLVESEFIEEMTDHFVDAIETTTTENVSFEEALNHAVDSFGGITAIRKMEWGFQKSFLKKQVREWWMAASEYFSRPKIYHSMFISIAVAILVFWIQPGKLILTESIFPGFLSGLIVPSLAVLTMYVVQRHLGWLRSVGLVTAQNIVNRLIPFVFFTISFLLFLLITEFCSTLIIREILCSLLGSIFAVLMLATLSYTSKRERKGYRPYRLS